LQWAVRDLDLAKCYWCRCRCFEEGVDPNLELMRFDFGAGQDGNGNSWNLKKIRCDLPNEADLDPSTIGR